MFLLFVIMNQIKLASLSKDLNVRGLEELILSYEASSRQQMPILHTELQNYLQVICKFCIFSASLSATMSRAASLLDPL